jgi:hypothetical protein
MSKTSLLIAGACALHTAAHGQGLDERVAARHHFGFGVPTWVKARATFSATRATNPGAAPAAPATLADGRVDRFYDDGYNRVNSAGNPVLLGEPRTTFFGYSSDAQVANAVGAGTLSMHSVQLNGGDYTRSLENQPFPGLEAFYRYDWKAGKNWSLSWELAAAYHFLHWEQNGAPNSTVDLLTDVFNLGGVALAPGAPYDGPFTPVPFTPLVGSTPTRAQATVAAAVAGRRKLDFHAIQLRLAPAFNWEPSPRWQFGLQAGLAVGLGFSQLNFAEQITVADPATPVLSQSGRSADTHAWGGLFSALRVARRLGENWDAHVEVRHVLTDTLRHQGPTRSAELNLSSGFGISAGVGCRF